MVKSVRLPRQIGLRVSLMLVLIGAVFSGALAVASSPKRSADNSTANKTKLAQAISEQYERLPLSFEANQGQTDERVKFMSRGVGYGMFLTGQEAVLTLHKPVLAGGRDSRPRLTAHGVTLSQQGNVSPLSRDASRESIASADPIATESAADVRETADVLRMQLAGANPQAEPMGMNKLPGTSNYFLGNDPAKWHAAVPTFAKVRYPGVYPGVDLVYYGNQRQLEYDFVVAPGGDPKVIRLHFAGAKDLKMDADGNLSIEAENGEIGFHKPEVYQMVGASRKMIAGKFKLLANNSISFELGRYDHSKALVIDPILAYSTYFGGTNAEFVVAVAADVSGNAYVTGLTISEDFPLTAGAFQAMDYATPSNAVSTAFVSKFNASGTALLYSTYIGGIAIPDTLHQQGDYGKAIAVDAAGDAYITGYTYSSDFPVTSGAFQKSNLAANVAFATGFVTKLNPSGTGLIYSTYLGGTQLDELTALAVDAAGDAYVSGISFSEDFPTTSGVIQPTNKSASVNGFNAVISKLNPTGSALLYSTYLGGASNYGTALGDIYWTNPIAVDKSGNAYVAGFTQSGNFPVSATAYQKTNRGGFNVTVSKLNPTASALLYSTYLGGGADSISEGLAVDSAGDAYVAGYTSGTNFPVTSGAFQAVNRADTNTANSSESNQNGFITKINPTGSGLVYSTYLGGTTGPWGGDQIYDLALDSSGDVYVAGSAMSADFPVTSNAYQSKNKGATHCCDYTAYTSNGFLTELNPSGTGLLYSTYIGGSGTQNPEGSGGSGDTAYGLTLGQAGNAYVVGFSTSANFPVTEGVFQTTYHTNQNTGFVADFNLGAAPTNKDTDTTLAASANPVVTGTLVTFTATVTPASGTVVPTGNVVFTVDEATVATIALNSAGKAVYSTSALVAGAHYVLASYAGSTTYQTSGDGFNEFITPAKPVIAPVGGTYMSQQTVTIMDSTAAAVIHYTLDGSVPTVFSPQYTGPITVNLSRTVNAIAVSQHDAGSVVVSAAYKIIGSPSVLAGPATGVSTPKATLTAFVNSLGISGTYYFEYGTSATALTSSTAKVALSASTTRVNASAALTSLAAKTKYYYHVVVTTAGGVTLSGIESFTTN